jgi:two-component system OmpR family response regulator
MSAPEAAGPCILVVDDDPMLRDLVAAHLIRAGYRVITANDGVQALMRVRDDQPDAMILDLSMPRLDGFGLLTRMQRLGYTTPTMVLTARHNVDDVRQSMGLGAKDYLAKPFEEQVLLGRVARLLQAGGGARG